MNKKRAFQISVLIIALVGMISIVWLLTQKHSPLYQPIQDYELTTPLKQLSKAEIDKSIAPYLGGSFWEIPLDKIQAELTRMDWIKSAEVKRKWPNLLYVSVVEQTPVARWNENGLINGAGEVFFPADISGYENLVLIEGELNDSSEILSKFIGLQNQLNVLNMTIEKLSFQNEVWKIQILKGPQIIVDSSGYETKIHRFIRALPKIDKGLRNSARVYDLRYSNGFIVAN